MNYPSPNTKQAFTLAEVLITLGIIGIVSAITIPTLVKNYQEYSYKQAWKKEYSTISQAYEQVKEDEGGDLASYFGAIHSSDPLISLIGDKLSFIYKCDGISTICGSNSSISIIDFYKTLSNGYVKSDNLVAMQYVLKNGANIYSRTYNANYAIIFVDVNGYSKKPNVLGRDLFGITLTKNKIMPMGAIGTGLENSCNDTSFLTNCPSGYGFHFSGSCSGAGCSAEYLYK